jgi:HSP20 family protein
MRIPQRKRKDDWDDVFESFDADMAEMRERMDELLERMISGKVSEARDPLIFGISMRVRPDGESLVQEFSNAGQTELSDAELPVREPLTDIREDASKVTVIMELPGVNKEDIKVTAEDRYLDLEVDSPVKRYTKHLELPCNVIPDSAKANYKNGVLEVVMRRRASKKRRKTVQVD